MEATPDVAVQVFVQSYTRILPHISSHSRRAEPGKPAIQTSSDATINGGAGSKNSIQHVKIERVLDAGDCRCCCVLESGLVSRVQLVFCGAYIYVLLPVRDGKFGCPGDGWRVAQGQENRSVESEA